MFELYKSHNWILNNLNHRPEFSIDLDWYICINCNLEKAIGKYTGRAFWDDDILNIQHLNCNEIIIKDILK